MLKVRRYDHFKDYEQMSGFWISRNMPIPTKDLLPHVGFIVDGFAAGFLYQTDSSLALIEGIISKDHVDHELRVQALDMVCEALVGQSKILGIERVLALTEIFSMCERAKRFGFNYINEYKLLVLDNKQREQKVTA